MDEIKVDDIISVERLAMGHSGINGWENRPNSAGGVEVSITFTNRSPTPIKYAVFCAVAYNSVGDTVACNISRKEEARMKVTGPYVQGKRSNARWDPLWYNHSITYIELTKIEIEYMDGSKKEVDGSEIVIGARNGGATSGGCYVATAVYGSYNCPEVWTLRRYRDNALAQTWYGMALIRLYYAISPTLVRLFGHTTWFNRFWRNKLDKFVTLLKEKGYSDHPYVDQ